MDDDRRPAPTATNESTVRLQRGPPTVLEREYGYRRIPAAHKMQYLRKMTICSVRKQVVHRRSISALIGTPSVSCSRRISMGKMILGDEDRI